MRKLDLIDSERSMVVLEVDIQIDCVHGNLIRTKPIGNCLHLRLGMITKTRLLKPKRPQRWKWSWPSEPGVCGQHVLSIGSIKNVVVERAVLRAKRVRVRRFFAKIETRPPGIVKQ